jgi:hypothetical protein
MFLWRPVLEETIRTTIDDVERWSLKRLVQAHLICDRLDEERAKAEAARDRASATKPRGR